MATISRANLTLTTRNDERTSINVRYTVRFTAFERFLVENGLRFHEVIRVLGVDAGDNPSTTVLHSFPRVSIPVLEGEGDAPQLERSRTLVVARASLQEDARAGDNDEIRCSISVVPVGIPNTESTLTDIEVLTG